jgi:hypothetical protein
MHATLSVRMEMLFDEVTRQWRATARVADQTVAASTTSFLRARRILTSRIRARLGAVAIEHVIAVRPSLERSMLHYRAHHTLYRHLRNAVRDERRLIARELDAMKVPRVVIAEQLEIPPGQLAEMLRRADGASAPPAHELASPVLDKLGLTAAELLLLFAEEPSESTGSSATLMAALG